MNLGRISMALGLGLAVLGSAGLASAQGMGGMGMRGMGMGGGDRGGSGYGYPDQGRPQSRINSVVATGKIRAVDRNAGTLTIRHASIPSIGMPVMTMVLGVGAPEMLEQVEKGETVSFAMESVGGRFMVTEIEAVR